MDNKQLYKNIRRTSNISSLPEVGGNAAFYLNDVTNSEELSNLIEILFSCC